MPTPGTSDKVLISCRINAEKGRTGKLNIQCILPNQGTTEALALNGDSMSSDKYETNRPSLPAELRRAIEVESGHACAVKGCSEHTYLEIHHIDQDRNNNNPQNLILLCDKHHKMAHNDVIDRKALRLYKAELSPRINVSVDSLAALLTELCGPDISSQLINNPGAQLQIVLNPASVEELQPYIQSALVVLRSTGSICSMGMNSRVGNHIEELKRPYGLGNGFLLSFTGES